MRILVVDDDAGSRTSVARFLKTMGHKVIQCQKAEEAMAALDVDTFPLVLSDIKMPEVSGLDLLHKVSLISAHKRPKVVLFTGHGSMESAIEALRMGAYDYLLKPVKAGELMTVVNKIAVDTGIKKESHLLPQGDNKGQKIDEIYLGEEKKFYIFSPQMQQVVNQSLKYYEDRSIPTLIQGETGTGKELIARLIHSGGNHSDLPFIDINCAAISPTLFESELFGYTAGSFTGGRGKGQSGKFDIARGGTIFLDEVAEIPIELQSKLLRVVEEGEYYPIGGLKKVSIDARIICATNVNLRQAVDEGKFRRDLYYRLQVGEILLPPLRERKDDILPLALSFLIEFSRQKQKDFTSISSETERDFLAYHWPGNIRELKNLIRWAVFMHNEKDLQPHHLETEHPLALKTAGKKGALTNYLDNRGSMIDKHVDQLVQDALTKCKGNKASTARYLGISRRSLYRLLERVNN